MEPVAQSGPLGDETVPVDNQIAQPGLERISGHRPPHLVALHLGEAGEQPGIGVVTLLAAQPRLPKGGDLGRVDHGDRDASAHQRRQQRPMVDASGFADDQRGGQRRQRGHQPGDAGGGVGHPPG